MKDTEKISDAQIREWANRHDLQGTLTDLRCIFEDARTFQYAAQPAQKPQEIDLWKTIRIEITPAAYDIATPERCLDTNLEYRDAKAIVDAHNASTQTPSAANGEARPRKQ